MYTIENKINNKRYVGYTQHLERRRNCHFNQRSNCPSLRSAIKKYGSENFEFILLEKCLSIDNVKNREIYWISELKSQTPYGYNLTFGGEGVVATDEVRKKLSKALKGKPGPNKGKALSEQHKRKIGEAQTGAKHHFYGKSFTKEHRAKIGQAQKNRKLSEEHKKAISKAHKGLTLSSKTKEKIRITKLGSKLSKEHKKHISSSIQKWWDNRRLINDNS